MNTRFSATRPVAFLTALVTGIGLAALAVAAPAAAGDPCGPGSNPIVCENSKPGTDPSIWDIQGAGDEEIQGFSTDISVNVGSSIGFKIQTASTNYSIDIFRTGYYGGLGARKIATISPSAPLPQTQPQCMTDATTEITDCGNWAVSATWNVPSTAVSGVYVALLKMSTGQRSQILFIVRDDSSHSQVVYQTSDPTWEAYNTYGGSDFYVGAAHGRAYKVSYNRPFANRSQPDTQQDFYWGNEFPMVRFLEQNGYDVSYISGVDTDRYGSLLLNHKTFLSVGHDEYWSGAQRANVTAARDAGVSLAFFSGNEVYWRTRYEAAEAGAATPYRTLVSYKETWANAKIDPSTEWTGTWRDPRLASPAQGGGSPENALSGTFFMSNTSDAAITVSDQEGKLRIWRNTSLASLAPGTTAQLAPHTVGYESDEDPDNGFRPAGLIDMSTTTFSSPAYMMDFGTTTGTAQTTHHITLYRATSGALVFSAGSIQWTWGLDQTHDGVGAPADPRMQQATVNVLADMSALPSTLMSGLVLPTQATDTTGPTVQISSPTAGASIPNGQSGTITGTASDLGGVVASVEVSTDGVTWHRATGTSTWSYSYVQTGTGAAPLRVRASDDSANVGPIASVSVNASCPCSIYSGVTPQTVDSTDASSVELGLKFTATQSGYVTGVRFYKAPTNTGTHVGTLWSATGSPLASVTFSGESASGWQTASFVSAVPVTAGTTYVISYTAPNGHYSVQAGAFWYAGRAAPPLAVAGGWGSSDSGVYARAGSFPSSSYQSSQYFVDPVFTTVDTTPLTVNAPSPIANAGSVATTIQPSAVLSRLPASGTPTLALATKGGVSVAGTSSFDTSSRTLTFVPTTALANATTYVATVTAVGLSGTPSWSFTTAQPPQQAGAATVSFYDDSATPGTLEVADPSAVTLGLRFWSTTSGTVTGVRFYKGPDNVGTHTGALWAVGSSTPVATGTFTNETSTGWQTLTFATPVHINANTQYVASYRTQVGLYSLTPGAFSGTGLARGPLQTDATSGAYSYADAYPGSSSSSSYMVDVVFTQDATALTVVSQTPAPGATEVVTSAPVSITFNLALASGASLGLTNAGAPVPGTSALSTDGKTLTFTPTSALAGGAMFVAATSALTATGGGTLAGQTWSFTTAGGASGCPCTLFGSQVPVSAAANDSSSVELGVSFTPTTSGQVTGVRFYKGTGNGGTHTGTLWSASGTQLAKVTFTGESASGWQTATFATPYQVVAGTTYVVSYLAPQGHYANTANAFAQNQTIGPLTVPAAGNGRYRYGGGFPTSTWQQTNYFVDVVFTTGPAVPPTVTSVSPASGATGVARGTTVTATLSQPPASGTPTIALTGPGGSVAGSGSYDAANLRVSFVPSAPLAAGTTYSVSTTLNGQALTGGASSFTTTAATSVSYSLWSDSDVPAVLVSGDTSAVQVGTRFSSSVAGTVTAIRFYKGSANTGTHTVYLWDGSGNLLAQATPTSETATGWQTVTLTTPVAVTAGQTYIASYYSTSGQYSYTGGALSTARTTGPLATSVPGGAYLYGTGAPVKTSTAWYGVDLVLATAG